jgi:hypothetical protein
MKKLKKKILDWIRARLFPETHLIGHVIQIPTETILLQNQSVLTHRELSDMMHYYKMSEDEVLRRRVKETVEEIVDQIMKQELVEIRIREDEFESNRRFTINTRIMVAKQK